MQLTSRPFCRVTPGATWGSESCSRSTTGSAERSKSWRAKRYRAARPQQHGPRRCPDLRPAAQLNEAYAVLTNIAFLEGIHPLVAYQELCRLVGQLAVFSLLRRTPAIPRYNHDDLGGCFYRLKNYIDDLLSIVPEPDYQERPFVGHGQRMQVSLERTWLDQSAQLYIGVRQSSRSGTMRRAAASDRHEGRQL